MKRTASDHTPVLPPKQSRLQGQGSGSGVSITDLPEVVLIKILKLLSSEDLLNAVPVCPLWQYLACKDVLKQALALHGSAVATPHLLAFLQGAPDLKSLEITGRGDLIEVLTEVTARNHSLQRLCVRGCKHPPQPVRIPSGVFLSLIYNCAGITDLTIEWCKFDDSMLLTDIIDALPGLRKITFKGTSVAGVHLPEIAERCSETEEVRLLRNQHFLTSESEILTFLTLLQGTLKVLELDNTVAVTENIAAAFASCHKMQNLHLLCSLRDDELQRLHTLAEMNSLTSLGLVAADLVSTSAWLRFFNIKWSASLRAVDLFCCVGVDDWVLYRIASQWPCLEDANFSGCYKVSDKGVAYIIKGCRNLRELKLWCLEDCVARSFSLMPRHTPALRTLVYEPMWGEMPDFAELKKQLPRLDIRSSLD